MSHILPLYESHMTYKMYLYITYVYVHRHVDVSSLVVEPSTVVIYTYSDNNLRL